MPPQIALILVSMLVATVFYIECKQSKEVSAAAWIPTIWLLYSGSKNIGTWLNIRATMEAGSVPDRWFLLSLGALGLAILLKRKFAWRFCLRNNYLLVLVVLFMLISVSWSSVPGISFRRWVRELLAIIMISLVASETRPVRALLTAFKRSIYFYLPFSLLLIKYFPHYGRDYGRWTGDLMWIGVADQKNGLAQLCIFTAIFLIWSNWEYVSNWKSLRSRMQIYIDLFMLLLSIYLLMGPGRTFKYSATSTISLLIGLAIMIILSIRIKKGKFINKKIIIFFMILIIFFGTLLPFVRKIPMGSIATAFGRDQTLTGRTQIWATLVPYAYKKLFLGHGKGGFWTSAMREKTSSHAHNGYLDTILDIGIIGLLLFSIMFLWLVTQFIKLQTPYPRLSVLLICILFMILVHNIAESGLSDISAFPISLVVLFSATLGQNEIQDSLSSGQI